MANLAHKQFCYNKPELDFFPYFESNLSKEKKEKLKLDGDHRDKCLTNNIIYTIAKKELVVASNYKDLVEIGRGLAGIHYEDNICTEVSQFIHLAASDCVCRVMDLCNRVKTPNNVEIIVDFQGSFIAPGMGYYLKSGNQCWGYHELFCNGLFAILHGACRHLYSKLNSYVLSFEKWCFKHENENTEVPLTELYIEPEDSEDGFCFATIKKTPSKKCKVGD